MTTTDNKKTRNSKSFPIIYNRDPVFVLLSKRLYCILIFPIIFFFIPLFISFYKNTYSFESKVKVHYPFGEYYTNFTNLILIPLSIFLIFKYYITIKDVFDEFISEEIVKVNDEKWESFQHQINQFYNSGKVEIFSYLIGLLISLNVSLYWVSDEYTGWFDETLYKINYSWLYLLIVFSIIFYILTVFVLKGYYLYVIVKKMDRSSLLNLNHNHPDDYFGLSPVSTIIDKLLWIIGIFGIIFLSFSFSEYIIRKSIADVYTHPLVIAYIGAWTFFSLMLFLLHVYPFRNLIIQAKSKIKKEIRLKYKEAQGQENEMININKLRREYKRIESLPSWAITKRFKTKYFLASIPYFIPLLVRIIPNSL